MGVALRSSAGGVGVSASVGSIEMTGRAVEGDVPQIVSTQSGMTHGFRCEQGLIQVGNRGSFPPNPMNSPPPPPQAFPMI